MAWDREVDLVSIGSGLGGVCAAITAADAGGEVLVLEKASGLGGVSGWSLGEVWTGPTSLSEALGIADSTEEVTKYLEFIGCGNGDPKLLAAFLAACRASVDYFVGIGIELEVARGFPDYYYTQMPYAKAEGRMLEIKPFSLNKLGKDAERLLASPHGYGIFSTDDIVKSNGDPAAIYGNAIARAQRNERCAGAGLMAAFIHAALERGVEFLVDSPAVKLLAGPDGGVEGVIAQTPKGELRIRARRGVVLATGGYDYNAKLMRQFEQVDEIASMAPPTITGDHFALAGDLGGFVGAIPPYLTPHPLGIEMPGQQIDGHPMFICNLPGQPYSVMVNRDGERFADEAFYHDHDAQLYRFDGRRHRRFNWPAWLVFDQSYRDSYPLGLFPPGTPLPPETAVTADTLEELASKAGIDPEGLRASVDRINGFCETGVDEDFGRGEFPWSHIFVGDRRKQLNPNLGVIEKAPFYAVKLHQVSISAASAGLVTNEHAQVLTARGDVVKRLYAVGNAAARLDVGGYQSGVPNARGMAFGYVSGRHIMTEAAAA